MRSAGTLTEPGRCPMQGTLQPGGGDDSPLPDWMAQVLARCAEVIESEPELRRRAQQQSRCGTARWWARQRRSGAGRRLV